MIWLYTTNIYLQAVISH